MSSFLGLELAEYINNLSYEYKINNHSNDKSRVETKWLLKNMLRNKYSDDFIDRKNWI